MTLASEPIATQRSRQHWLLIGIPVVLLLFKGANTLYQLATGGIVPERFWLVAAFAVLSIVAALLLFIGGRLGWLLALGVIGWDLALALALWWIGSPNYVAMALLTLCAILVTSPEMRAAHLRSQARS
jgi:hypothetical protein